MMRMCDAATEYRVAGELMDTVERTSHYEIADIFTESPTPSYDMHMVMDKYLDKYLATA